MNMQNLNTKLVIILPMFYKSTHCNNSNYLLLFSILYLYFIDTRSDAIILSYYLRLTILYYILQKKLKIMTFLDMT